MVKISIPKIKIISFSLLDKYLHFLRTEKAKSYPPKKSNKASIKKCTKINDNSISINESNYRVRQSSFKQPLKSPQSLLDLNNKNKIRNKKKDLTINEKSKTKIKSNIGDKLNNSYLPLNDVKSIKAYLATSMDDLDYDELLVKENRPCWKIFLDKLIVSQMIINLFHGKNWIIPKSIRFIFLIVMVDLYFVVNALFYNEEYIRDLYYLDEEETLFSFVPRSLNRIIYTSLASSVLDFIISLLFPTENKIKKILIRKKDKKQEMKTKVFVTMRNIINNYWLFIIISYIMTIISWYYITCFNNVYPYLKLEWIKSSIFILIIIQISSILICGLFAFLRFISIKCKSEKIYRISNYFFN